jgi:hypothetical protein
VQHCTSDSGSDSEDSYAIRERLEKRQRKKDERKQRQLDEQKSKNDNAMKAPVEERNPFPVFYVSIESCFTHFINSSNLNSFPNFRRRLALQGGEGDVLDPL